MNPTTTPDPLYDACKSFLDARRCTLWSDFILPDNADKAAAWLSDQIQGVAEHYDATQTPFFTTATEPLTTPYDPRTTLQAAVQADPDYTTTPRTADRPSALVTHGQQPERW